MESKPTLDRIADVFKKLELTSRNIILYKEDAEKDEKICFEAALAASNAKSELCGVLSTINALMQVDSAMMFVTIGEAVKAMYDIPYRYESENGDQTAEEWLEIWHDRCDVYKDKKKNTNQ